MGLFSKISEMRMKDPVDGVLRVVGVNRPDPTATTANYRIEGVVSGPGVAPTAVVHSGLMSTGRWPSPGEELDCTVDRADPRRIVLKKHERPNDHQRAMSAAEALAEQMRGAPEPGTAASTADAATDPTAPAIPVPPPYTPDMGQPAPVSAADILERGIAATATLQGTYASPLPPPDDQRTSIGLTLTVEVPGNPPYPVQNLYAVPLDKLATLVPGTTLPVKVLAENPGLVAVDWNAV